ncbi:MAG TPA: hypothetical protein VG028_11745, partial [Terriglobia bacterium]|nr:hypothetical protein [Terriglobia bacterium]
YALKAGDAETLGGKPASAYMLSETQSGATASAASTNTVQTGSSSNARKSQSTSKSPLTACSSVTSDGTATANSIALFTTACNLESANLVQFNGNLGFGISTPGARLHIFGPDNTDSDARFNFILGDSTSATAGTGGGILFSGYYNGTTSKAGFANIRGIKENSIQGNYATAMVFDTRANGGNQTERMRISSTGSLGIGTSNPAAMLEVNGTAKFDGVAAFSAGEMVTGGVTATMFSGSGSGLTGIAPASLTSPARTRVITYLAGCDSCAPLESSDSQTIFYFNVVDGMTLDSVTCFADGGSPKINIARHNGGPTNLLSSNLTCNGTPTTSFTSTTLALNDELDFVMAVPDGVAKRITVVIQTSLN